MNEKCKQCAKINCPVHPDYEGRNKPRCSCEACWDVWNKRKKQNAAIIASVKAWQSDETIHPLTCGKDSNHELLEVFEDNGTVKLRCPDCDYIQDWVPPIVMDMK